MSVVFYNTQFSPPPKDAVEQEFVTPANTAIFMPLLTVSKDTILYFKNFKESSDHFDFHNKYGSSGTNNLSDALWLCSRMIVGCNYRLQSSTIVLITNNEQPNDQAKATIKAKDLRSLNVQLILTPMVDEFDDSIFYKEFLCTISGDDPEDFKMTPPSVQRENLLSRTYKKDNRKTALRYFNLSLGTELEISCGIYSFTTKTVPPKTVQLMRNTNEVVTSKRSYFLEEFNEETSEYELTKRLIPGELVKYRMIGAEKIVFSQEEVAATQSLMPPGMKLLGFKPLSVLPKLAFVKSCKFLYPNEKNVTGSTKLFAALWKKCVEKEKYALCIFAQIRKVAPR